MRQQSPTRNRAQRDNFKGANTVERNIHKENIARRVQNYAFASNASDIGQGLQDLMLEDPNARDDEEPDSQNKSVQLDDSALCDLERLDMDMNSNSSEHELQRGG